MIEEAKEEFRRKPEAEYASRTIVGGPLDGSMVTTPNRPVGSELVMGDGVYVYRDDGKWHLTGN